MTEVHRGHHDPSNEFDPTSPEAIRTDRLVSVARNAFQEIVDGDKKLRRLNRRGKRANIYAQLPEEAVVCAGILVFAGYVRDAQEMAQTLKSVAPGADELHYQTALMHRGDSEAMRCVRKAQVNLEGEATTRVLVDLAACGDEEALSHLGDDMRENPQIVAELLAAGVPASRIQSRLVGLPVSDLKRIQDWHKKRKRNPVPPAAVGQLLPELILGDSLDDLAGSAPSEYDVDPYFDLNVDDQYLFDKKYVGGFKRLKFWITAQLKNDTEFARQWVRTEAEYLGKISDRVPDWLNGANLEVISDLTNAVSAFSILAETGYGFMKAQEEFHDLSVEEKAAVAPQFIRGAQLAGEFEAVEGLLKLIDDPRDRIMVVYDTLKAMGRQGYQIPARYNNDVAAESPTLNRYSFVADDELLARVYALRAIAQLDVSTDLQEAYRMVDGIADPGLRKKAREALDDRYEELKRFAAPLGDTAVKSSSGTEPHER